MDFCSLQHLQESKVRFTRACQPATFHLQGLVTLLAVSSLRSRAGFISRRQRSWDSPLQSVLLAEGRRDVSAETEPAYRFRRRYLPSPKRLGRHDGPRFPGFGPSASPLRSSTRLARRSPAALLGFRPSKANHRRPQARSLPPSSHALLRPAAFVRGPAPQSLGQPSTGVIPASCRSTSRSDHAALLGFPHRHDPIIQASRVPGYEFTSCRRPRCRDSPAVLETRLGLAGAVRDRRGCRAVATSTSQASFSIPY